MRILFHSHIIRARLIAAFLLLMLRGPAAEPNPANATLEDTEANLPKSMQGYKVGDPARYRDLFAPLRTEKAALSPDGKHLAYTVREDEKIYVHIVAIDQSDAVKARVEMRDLRDANLSGIPWDFDAQLIDWLGWVNNTRLVFAGNWSPAVTGVIMAVNADGSDARLLAIPAEFSETTYARNRGARNLRIIGLQPGSGDSIVLAATVTAFRGIAGVADRVRTMHIAYSLNTLTGETDKLSEVFVKQNDWALRDRSGKTRITITPKYSDSPGFKPPILYHPAEQPESALPLGEQTGVDGFTFGPDNVLGESSVPLGFDASGDVLYYASNFGRDTHGIYAVNLKTKHRLRDILESPRFDLLSPELGTFAGTEYFDFTGKLRGDWAWGHMWRPSSQLVMDRFDQKFAGVRYDGMVRTAVWFLPELRELQDWLAINRVGRSAEILEWDESLNRFLVREQGPANPGAFYVFDREKSTYTQFARRSSAHEAGSIAQLTPFDIQLVDGSRIDGFIALPRNTKIKKVPLVLLCPNVPWERRGASYQREFEALTRMGFAVAIYNGRGAWGTGIKERQKLQGDYVSVQVADVVAVADHLAAKFNNLSAKAVALLGQGHGGYLALRALQLHPERFRCAVTINGWRTGMELFDAIVQGRPAKGSREEIGRPAPTPLTEHPELIKSPVFTIVEFSESPRFHANTALHRAVKRNAPDSELFVQTDKLAERPQVLARQWARTESFLNYVLYSFSVRLGELEILPDEAPKPKQP
jgi:pimeloyl-ACP methyl ester carboxylesterase